MALTARTAAGWAWLLVAAGLAAVGWAAAAVLFARPGLKRLWDLSPQARFSVEPATAELLAQLRDTGQRVEFHTLYVPLSSIRATGPEGEQIVGLHRRVQDLTTDLLRQYAYLGGDAVTVAHHDLLREPAEIREVLREVERRSSNTVIVKVGKRSRVLHLLDDLAELDVPMSAQSPVPGARPAIPALKSYKGEEALSTALRSLLVEGVPKVYFATDSGASLTAGLGVSFSELVGALSDEGFAVAELDLRREQRVPDDAAVVALLEPRHEIGAAAAEAVWAYLRRGGRVLVTVSYYDALPDWNPRLPELGERLGFALGDELVCHVIPDPSHPNQSTSGSPMVQNLVAAGLNPLHPVTRPLWRAQRYPLLKGAREIRAVDGAHPGVRLDTSILRTSPGAWLEERPVDFIAPPGADAYAARCIGAIADVDPEHGDRTGHFVLIAAAGFENLGFGQNGDLALNLFAWLAERKALVSIRGSKYVARDLTLAPQQLERTFWFLVAGVPGAFLLLALAVFWRRQGS